MLLARPAFPPPVAEPGRGAAPDSTGKTRPPGEREPASPSFVKANSVPVRTAIRKAGTWGLTSRITQPFGIGRPAKDVTQRRSLAGGHERVARPRSSWESRCTVNGMHAMHASQRG